jgi:hypothetical protein
MKYKTIAVFTTIISIMLIQSVLLTTTFQDIQSAKAVSRADQGLTSSDLGKKEQEQPQPHTQTQTAPERQPPVAHTQRAPIATSGDNNVYVAWWSNKTGNDEVMFKASTDGGKTFGGKINLSNSNKSNSQDVQIAAAGNNVYVTWWERNQTMNEPLMRISNDNGKTFGEMMTLSSK